MHRVAQGEAVAARGEREILLAPPGDQAKLMADGVTDPVVVQKRKDELKPGLKEDIDKCVGRRVTDGMMNCVKASETAEQIDKCLR